MQSRALVRHGQLLLCAHLRATLLVPDCLWVSAFLPSPQVTSPHPGPYSHLPIGLSFALKAVSVPSIICLSGQYRSPGRPPREDRTTSCLSAVSPGRVCNRCSACVGGQRRGWTRLDIKYEGHVTHGPHLGSRATSNGDPEFPNLTARSAPFGWADSGL